MTDVLLRLIINLSVAVAVVVIAAPPETNNVLPSSIVCGEPVLPDTINVDIVPPEPVIPCKYVPSPSISEPDKGTETTTLLLLRSISPTAPALSVIESFSKSGFRDCLYTFTPE